LKSLLALFLLSALIPPINYSLDNTDFQVLGYFGNLIPGDYNLYVQDANGCISDTPFSVESIDQLSYEIDNTEMRCEDDSILVSLLLNTGNPLTTTYSWFNGQTTPTTWIHEPGIYNFQINGECENISTNFEVNIVDDRSETFIYVPNAFSPNEDGYNDLFLCYPANDVEILSFEIHLYNRWGEELFATQDITIGWDGQFMSRDLNPGVYVWYIDAMISFCGREMNLFKKGDVTILR